MAFPTNPTNGEQANVNGVTYTYSSSLSAWTVTSNFLETFTGNALIANTATIAGELSSATIVAGNILPSNSGTYNLGSAENVWAELYVSGNSLHVGNVIMTNPSGSVVEFFAADGTTPATISSQNVDATQITNGESSVSISSPNGMIVATVNGSAIATASQSGLSITGNATVSGSTSSNFFVSPRTISANTTVGNINAMSSGPVIIANGVTVTVSSGGDWSIL